jgi:integrase
LRVGEVAALRIADITAHERSALVRIREGKGLKAREVRSMQPHVARCDSIWTVAAPGPTRRCF